MHRPTCLHTAAAFSFSDAFLALDILYWFTQTSEHDTLSLDQVKIDMAGPKLGRQRMAIAAEGASAQSHVEIVKAVKSPAVLDLLGALLIIAWHICVIAVTL